MLCKQFFPKLFSVPQIVKFCHHLSFTAQGAAIVGGAVRDSYLAPKEMPNDLDIVVLNHEYDATVQHLQGLSYAYSENRHGNARFYIDLPDVYVGFKDPFHVDVWSPARFYGSYGSIEEMLAHFDLSINALGIGILSGHIYDPVDGIEDLQKSKVRLLEEQWSDKDDDYIYHLVKRLNTLLDRYPYLEVVNPELALQQIERLEKLQKITDMENKQNNDLFNELKMITLPSPPHAFYGTTALGPLSLKWIHSLPEASPEPKVSEPEVCQTWLKGDRCPGCTGCPFEGPDGIYGN